MTTIAFWKPYGVLSQFSDRSDPPRPTLADYIDLPAVYGAGRLDRDSEGLLILSDDPSLRTTLTEPRHAVPRTYAVQVEGTPDDDAISSLRDGVVMKGRRTQPARAQRLETAPDFAPRDPPIRTRRSIPETWIELTLTEGRNRQVRRMTAAVGHPTLRLVRIRVGTIDLAGLVPGMWRELGDTEIDRLKQAELG